MKLSMFSKVKQIFLNQPYIALYPISDKSDKEKAELVESFNTCNISEESETATLLNTIYEYTLAKIETTKMDKDSIERNLANSYKTKKHKIKDKETGEKKVEKIKTEKKGNKRIIERFQKLQDENSKHKEKYEDLLKAIENGTLTVKHLPLIDDLLKENKYKTWIYKLFVILVIVVPITIFILAKVVKI